MDKAKLQFKRLRRGNYRYLIYAFTGLVLIFIGWLWAKNGVIDGPELAIFRFFNSSGQIITDAALVITLAGTIWFSTGLAIFMLFWRRYAFAAEIFIAGVLVSVVAALIKGFDIRLRPFEILSNVHIAGIKYTDMGFPSIHASVITAIAVVVTPRLGSGFRTAAWILVVLVCISRMILGMHAPLDIVGGLGVGIIVGSMINYFAGVPKPQLSSIKSLKIKNKKKRQANLKRGQYAE
jgi:undecaprenyl-diphosphatase